MKKFLSLIMVVAMLVAVFAMVGCGDETKTTTEAPKTETTTKAPETETTTEAPVTETTTEEPETETTTKEPEETTTKEPEETTTKAPDTTTTAKPVDTTTTVNTPAETTTGKMLGIFDRFDWGTKSKAQDEGETSHEYLVANLTIDESRLAIEYTEDTIVIYARKAYDSSAARDSYALQYLDIVTYDFDDEFIPGWGEWAGAPMNPGTSWGGRYQYAKLRIKNNTTNNIICVHWHRAGEGFATTTVAASMYLQGGAPTASNKYAMTATAKDEWVVYYYDMMFLSGVGRESVYQGKDYLTIVSNTKNNNSYPQNNWNTAQGNITALNFHFLGAYGKSGINDTRSNIKMGQKVEVDYMVFGCSLAQLEGYTSYIEDEAN